MSRMREILYAANRAANYDHEALRSQVERLNVYALEGIVEKAVSRAIVLAHALDVFKEDSEIKHPMQAFLHAAECPTTGVTLDDAEFFACLAIWGRWCEAADRANEATPVGPTLNEALGPFAQRFMRSE